MIIVDLETTGADYKEHSITQIAAIEFENPGNRFEMECRIWDGAQIDDFTYDYNGYTDESLHDDSKKSDIEIVEVFLKWAESVDEKTIVGENPAFDRDFMRFTLMRNRKEWPLGYRTLDLHTLTFNHHVQRGVEVPHEKGFSKLNLDATLEYCGLPKEPSPHTARNGALYETEALGRLLYGVNTLADFQSRPIPNYLLI